MAPGLRLRTNGPNFSFYGVNGASPLHQDYCVKDGWKPGEGSAKDIPAEPSGIQPSTIWWYLAFCQVEVDSDFVAPQSGQVVVVSELWLQFPDLLLGEGCALLPGFAAAVLRLYMTTVTDRNEGDRNPRESPQTICTLDYFLTLSGFRPFRWSTPSRATDTSKPAWTKDRFYGSLVISS